MSSAPQSLAAALGDRYLIEGELGQGGMATVYRARDLRQQRTIALKVLRPELATLLGPERFLNEIVVTAGLQHPNILPIFDSGQAGPFLYYTTRFVEGESLRSRLDRVSQLPLEEALAIVRQVAEALEAAHARGIIHRDVKPENILLADAHVWLADFGIAKTVAGADTLKLTATGFAVGTPLYMSPEQSAAGTVDPRSDEYSLGCVLYEMLAGAPPFTGPTPQAVSARHARDPVPPLRTVRPAISEELEEVVQRALAKLPADRFPTPVAFAEAATRAGRVRPRRRAPLLGRLGIIAGALILLAGIGAWSSLSPSRRALLRTLVTRPRPTLADHRIVVAPFANLTGDSTLATLGALAADGVVQGILSSGFGEVVDARTALFTSELVARLPRPLRGGEPAIALAREVGAATVVWGSYFLEGTRIRFRAQITDVASGRLLRLIDEVDGARDDVAGIVHRLRDRVGAGLAIAVDPAYGSWSTGFATPPTLVAYENTVQGFEAYYRGRIEEAVRRLTAASASDSTYMTPRLVLGYIYATRGDIDYPRIDSLIHIVEPHADRLPPTERAILDHLRCRLQEDLECAYRTAETLMRLAPGSAEIPTVAAANAVYVLRPRAALAALAATDPRRGLLLVNPTYWRWKTAALHQLRRFADELAAAEEGLQQFPEDEIVLTGKVRALAALGRQRQVLEVLRATADAGPDWRLSRGLLALIASFEFRAHGFEAAAGLLADSLVAVAESYASDTSAVSRGNRILMMYTVGRYREAELLIHSLQGAPAPDGSVWGMLGVIAAHLGDVPRARAYADSLARDGASHELRYRFYWRARIAAVLGERETAITLLVDAHTRGYSPWASDFAPLHEEPDFANLRSMPGFQALLKPRDGE